MRKKRSDDEAKGGFARPCGTTGSARPRTPDGYRFSKPTRAAPASGFFQLFPDPPRPMRFFSLCVLLPVILALAPAATAQPASVCDTALEAAAAQYRDGAFQETIRLASSCLDQREVATEDARAAYRLLILAYLKQDDLASARKSAVTLLGVDPDYTPDPVANPPDYVSLLAVVRQEIGPETTSDEPRRRPFFQRTSTWITLGTTLVAGGVVSLVVLNGGDDGSEPPPASGPGTLPAPPGVPPN
jgi:hypothetical protein